MRFLSSLGNLVAGPAVAIDLGSANTRVYALGRGLVAEQPTSVEAARDPVAGRPTVGAPIQGGAVVDVQAAAALLQSVLGRSGGLARPRALICAPTDASPDERVALEEVTRRGGALEVEIIPAPLAAAIGAGLDVSLGYAQLVVDIGHGVMDIAVIRAGSLPVTASLRVGCGQLHAAAAGWVEEHHGILLPARETEALMQAVGARQANRRPPRLTIKGINRKTGREVELSIGVAGIGKVFAPVVLSMVRRIRELLRRLPDDLAAEVIESGVSVTGGGACVPCIVEPMAEATKLEVRVASDPLRAVIRGAGQLLELRSQKGWAR